MLPVCVMLWSPQDTSCTGHVPHLLLTPCHRNILAYFTLKKLSPVITRLRCNNAFKEVILPRLHEHIDNWIQDSLLLVLLKLNVIQTYLSSGSVTDHVPFPWSFVPFHMTETHQPDSCRGTQTLAGDTRLNCSHTENTSEHCLFKMWILSSSECAALSRVMSDRLCCECRGVRLARDDQVRTWCAWGFVYIRSDLIRLSETFARVEMCVAGAQNFGCAALMKLLCKKTHVQMS